MWSNSSKLGFRKPDPRIYQHACELIGVPPERCVYLDDLGINLKPAKALGMRTIKVGDPDVAIAELEAIVGIPLKDNVIPSVARDYAHPTDPSLRSG